MQRIGIVRSVGGKIAEPHCQTFKGQKVITISITDKKTVEIKRGNSVSVDGSNVLTYGEKVSKLTLVNTVFVEAGTDDVIEGILSWSNPDEIPAAGTTPYLQ